MKHQDRHKWTQGIPTNDGWYWLWNGEERMTVIIRDGILYLNEKCDKPGYTLDNYLGAVNMWWRPCFPPPIPQ